MCLDILNNTFCLNCMLWTQMIQFCLKPAQSIDTRSGSHVYVSFHLTPYASHTVPPTFCRRQRIAVQKHLMTNETKYWRHKNKGTAGGGPVSISRTNTKCLSKELGDTFSLFAPFDYVGNRLWSDPNNPNIMYKQNATKSLQCFMMIIVFMVGTPL